MNVSEAFTQCMQNMHKRKLEKNYQQKTIEQRLTNFKGARRQTRDTFMLQRRNIDLDNMSPIVTPQVTKKKATAEKTKKDTAKPAKSNKRLDMLQKWKEEKEKIKKEAKKKAKPIFKVCHVSHEVAAADLEKVNREIKGKPIKKEASVAKSSWAPLNHKFRPPKNIKPIEVHVAPTAAASSTTSRTNSSKNKASPVRRVTRAQSSKPEEKRKLASVTLDAGKTAGKNPLLRKIEQPEAKAKKPIVDKTALKPSNKKNVGWDVVDMTGSDDDGFIPKSCSKKRYAKTPIKRKKSVISVSDDEEGSFKTPPRQSQQRIAVTPHDQVFTNSVPKSSSKKKYTNREKSVDEEESLKTPPRQSQQRRAVTPYDQVFTNSVPKSSSKKKYTNREKSVDEEESLKTPPRQSQQRRAVIPHDQVFTNSVPKSSSKKKYTNREKSVDEEESLKTPPRENLQRKDAKVTIYSDEEVSLKTPRRSLPKTAISAQSVDKASSPAYISPFVTISRGKESARKEFKSRLSTGGAFPVSERGISNATSPKMGAEYFARLLDQEVERLESVCARWEKYKDENELSEEAQTLIFVPIGQSRLLMSKKFQQFRGLIDKCRRCQYEDDKPITCEDLHGFWDMVYMQVLDLNKRFEYLEKVKENDWEEVVPEKKRAVAKRPRGRPKKTGPPSRLRDFIRVARSRKGEPDVVSEASAAQPLIVTPAETTPAKRRFSPVRPSSTRRSLRVSLLCGKTPKRPSTSPCLAIMKISRAIKTGDGVTPSKSILKTERTKTEGGMSKSVLFKDDLEEDPDASAGSDGENDARVGNLMSFSPAVPARRSSRLSRLNS